MAKPHRTPTRVITFRFKHATAERLERYVIRHPLQPSMAQVAEAAVLAYLDAHEPELPPDAKPPRKPAKP